VYTSMRPPVRPVMPWHAPRRVLRQTATDDKGQKFEPYGFAPLEWSHGADPRAHLTRADEKR